MNRIVAQSFVEGFNLVRKTGRELTRREIETEYPAADVDAFAQGNVDGVKEDHFRFGLVVKIWDAEQSLRLRDPKLCERLAI